MAASLLKRLTRQQASRQQGALEGTQKGRRKLCRALHHLPPLRLRAADQTWTEGCPTVGPPELFANGDPPLGAHFLSSEREDRKVATRRRKAGWSRL